MLFNMDERGRKCWESDVGNILFSLGFGYAWLQQGFGCETAFISLIKQEYLSKNEALFYCKKICMQSIEISKAFLVQRSKLILLI